jgi:lipid-A-disaccharide synthase
VGGRPRIVIIAGEISGDHQGAHLARTLRRVRPDLAISGVGGPQMRGAGVDLLVDSVRWGVIGYAETYVRLPLFAIRFWRLVRIIERTRPDLLVLVDFPGMNRELVRHFSGRLPMVYLCPPQTYGRRGRSAARMARAAVRLLAVLPFEAEAYARAGADVTFVGHPAVDTVAEAPASAASLRAEWGVRSGPVVGLLPGSRTQEVGSLLPPMLDAAERLHAAHGGEFLLPVAGSHLAPHVERAVGRAAIPIRLIDGRAFDVMKAADAVVVASGTATVEAACVGVPMVVVYRVSWLTEWIIRRFVITPDPVREGYSLPSIIVGRPIVPELLQDDVNGARIFAEVERLLVDPILRERVGAALAEVRRRLGPPGVMERAAGEVLRVLDSRSEVTVR